MPKSFMDLYDMAATARSSVVIEMQCEWATKAWMKLEAEDMEQELTLRV